MTATQDASGSLPVSLAAGLAFIVTLPGRLRGRVALGIAYTILMYWVLVLGSVRYGLIGGEF